MSLSSRLPFQIHSDVMPGSGSPDAGLRRPTLQRQLSDSALAPHCANNTPGKFPHKTPGKTPRKTPRKTPGKAPASGKRRGTGIKKVSLGATHATPPQVPVGPLRTETPRSALKFRRAKGSITDATTTPKGHGVLDKKWRHMPGVVADTKKKLSARLSGQDLDLFAEEAARFEDENKEATLRELKLMLSGIEARLPQLLEQHEEQQRARAEFQQMYAAARVEQDAKQQELMDVQLRAASEQIVQREAELTCSGPVQEEHEAQEQGREQEQEQALELKQGQEQQQ